MTTRRIGRILGAVLAIGMLGGCAVAGQDPEATATTFLQRFSDGDYAGACDLMVYTDDTPVNRTEELQSSCVGGMERLADQAARNSLDEWLASPRSVQSEGTVAVVAFTAVDGQIATVKVDGTWYVADPGIGQFTFA